MPRVVAAWRTVNQRSGGSVVNAFIRMHSMFRDERMQPLVELQSYVDHVGRKVDVEDLVGAYEISVRLGLSRPQLVHDWHRRHADFPKPVASLKRALVWDWRDVESWVKRTRKRPA